MKVWKLTIAIVAACLLWSAEGQARETLRIYGLGGENCTVFLETIAQAETAPLGLLYNSWAQGYLTGMNHWRLSAGLEQDIIVRDSLSLLKTLCLSTPKSERSQHTLFKVLSDWAVAQWPLQGVRY